MNTTNAFAHEAIEHASVDELRSLQLKRLQSTLQHAYANSSVYRAKFDAAGVHPSDCHSLSDLAKFPFTTKLDLRDSYPYGMFAVPREQCARIHASSGTTGKPTVVGYTRNDIDTWAHLVARSIRAAWPGANWGWTTTMQRPARRTRWPRSRGNSIAWCAGARKAS
jgi:phenylacetate-CoA ligase